MTMHFDATPLPRWLLLAFDQLGTKEIKGKEHNPTILKYHQYSSMKATTDEVPWCSSVMNYLMVQSGYKGTNSAAARSWLSWGVALKEPRLGCVTVLWRGSRSSWMGHVALYMGEDDSYLYLLGGNQKDEFWLNKYSKNQLLGHRWPS